MIEELLTIAWPLFLLSSYSLVYLLGRDEMFNKLTRYIRNTNFVSDQDRDLNSDEEVLLDEVDISLKSEFRHEVSPSAIKISLWMTVFFGFCAFIA